MAESESQKPVTVSLINLQKGSVTLASLEEAFGPSSLGILLVKDLPVRYSQLRQHLLSYASYLAALPPNILESLSCPEAKYLVGWSHGKETLKEGRFDTLKGSYYVTCTAPLAFSPSPASADRSAEFPEYTAANVWPSEDHLPGFKAVFEELCALIIETALLVARSCDRYAETHIDAYVAGSLERIVTTSTTTKARLLHYFPPEMASQARTPTSATPEAGENALGDDLDDWCATHVDHGCLTGLTSAMFIDETGGLPELKDPLPSLTAISSPDASAGLYIYSRAGMATQIVIPADCLAFQTGAALERLTEGKFRAVPHFVRGPQSHDARSMARNTLAVFTQPNLAEIVDVANGTSFAEFARQIVDQHI